MLIQYRNGRKIEALLLSATSESIRVLCKGAEDASEFRNVGETWVSEDCEPVQIKFAWEIGKNEAPVSEAECIYPPELARLLITVLASGDAQDQESNAIAPPDPEISASHFVAASAVVHTTLFN